MRHAHIEVRFPHLERVRKLRNCSLVNVCQALATKAARTAARGARGRRRCRRRAWPASASDFCAAAPSSRTELIAVHHARKELGFRNRSSSRCRSAVVMRSGWVVGVGVGKVRGKYAESSSAEGLFFCHGRHFGSVGTRCRHICARPTRSSNASDGVGCKHA